MLRFENQTKSQRRTNLWLFVLRSTAEIRVRPLRRLLEMLPGVVGKDADDAGGHDGRGHAKDSDERLNLCDFANNLGLKLLLVGDSVIEEELVFLVASELSLIGEQAEKTG